MRKMKRISHLSRIAGHFFLGIFVLFCISQCEQFPSNPENMSTESESVQIQHVNTDYITTETTLSGLATKKVNLLTFKIRANNFEAEALEIFGRVILEGPPFEREHNLHFRTDQLLQQEDGSCACFETIQAGLPYQLIRSKFPTNEYSPFCGDQGKVKCVIITNVIAYHADGESNCIPFMHDSE
ncbi:hypothetical protein JW835_05440 [bacterium]|nr:hypothetical protein [bacterium]